MNTLSNKQIERYSRQLILPQVGAAGQARLLASKVLIIGAGGLGSPAALYLAAAGVGTLGIADSDRVELHNLQRQILHATADVGALKAQSAAARLTAVNPDITIRPLAERLTAANALPIIQQYDAVVDGSDNVPTRYLINDACVLAGTPLVHGGVVQWTGQVTTILPRQGPCLRCLFPEPPLGAARCQEAGIVGAVAGVIGAMQATEIVKLLVGLRGVLLGRLWTYDGLSGRTREVRFRRDPACAVCGDHPTVAQLVDDTQPVCTHEVV